MYLNNETIRGTLNLVVLGRFYKGKIFSATSVIVS